MKNKKIWWFLIRFFGTYFLLLFAYFLFLFATEVKSPYFKSDSITSHVAKSTEWLLNIFDVQTFTEQHTSELSIKIFVNDYYVARVIEGCNSVSIIVLFIAFVVAFKGGRLNTVLFVLLGAISIYIVNIARIALLSWAMVNFVAYETILHDLLFPAIIYGYVFVLWLWWVNRFSNLKTQK